MNKKYFKLKNKTKILYNSECLISFYYLTLNETIYFVSI